MNCPKCGEPVRTRHSFCVICGADLEEKLSETPLKAAAEAVGRKTKRVRDVLNKPIGQRKAEPAPTPVEPVQQTEPAETAAPDTQDESLIVPDFMRNYM